MSDSQPDSITPAPAPAIPVTRLLPADFWDGADEDEQKEQADVPENSQSFWQVWGTFIIIGVLIGMFLIALLLVVLYLPVKDWLNSVKAMYAAHMTTGTFIYLAVITLAIMLLIPSSMVEIFGVIVVGPYIGFALNLTGNMIAAAASYPLGRFMCSRWVRRTVRQSKTMLLVARAMHSQTYRAIIVIKLLYVPTGLKNYLLGAIPTTPFWPYMICSFVIAVALCAVYSAMGSVADSVLTKWQGTPLQIAMLCVAIVAFIFFFLLIYFASKNLMETMKKEHEAEEAKTEVEARLNSNVDENSNHA